MHSCDLAVLGAGPAGLLAAWRAALAGASVVVLERAGAVGGLAGSFDVAGVRVDHGSHRLHPATPPYLLAAVRDLVGTDLQTRRRNGRLRLAGRWVGFPLRAGELTRTLPPRLLARAAVDAATTPLRRPRADTYAELLRAGLGPALYGELYAPYARKLWGLAPERIAGEQARRRVTADTPGKVAARLLRRGPGPGRTFHYPRRGFGQLVEALAAAAADAGVDLRLSAPVTRVEPDRRRVAITAGGAELHAGQVFATVPLPVLTRLVSPPPPAAVTAAAGGLRMRAMLLVYLVHTGGRWTSYDAHYLPGLDTPVTRLSEPANYRDSAEDPGDRSVVCAEIPCSVGDVLWSATDAELTRMVTGTVEVTGLPPLRVQATEIRRVPHVYPVYEVGYHRHLAALDAWSRALPRVTTFGRLGLFAHDNTHHALAMGWAAAAALLPGGGFDQVAWSAARDSFAGHVVED